LLKNFFENSQKQAPFYAKTGINFLMFLLEKFCKNPKKLPGFA